jgi:hypothetical protein
MRSVPHRGSGWLDGEHAHLLLILNFTVEPPAIAVWF